MSAPNEYETVKAQLKNAGISVTGMEIFKGCDDLYSSRRKKGSMAVRHALRLHGGTTLCFDRDKKFLGISAALGRSWLPRGV
jgi:hypothetical protein